MGEAFWRGVQRGWLYGTWLSIPVWALLATWLPAYAWGFLGLACVSTAALAWMTYTLGRQDEQEAEVRRRAQRLQEHPEWPVCEMHRRG